MVLSIITIVLSLVILSLGAEGLVRGSSSLALKLGLSPLMVGLTVVAFGTSSPELVVSLRAALSNQGDLAIGNAVGSNIFNIGIILGLTALMCPLPVKLKVIKWDLPIMLVVALALPFLMLEGNQLNRAEGLLLVAGLIGYMYLTYYLARREKKELWEQEFTEGVPKTSRHWASDLLFIVGGLALLGVGSQLLVNSGIDLARMLGVSEAVIGLTIIASGTSMPELATSVVAAIRREPDIAIGNIVGSNIFNILAILGISSAFKPLVANGINTVDLAVMAFLTLLLMPLARTGSSLSRAEGGLLLLCYAGYVYYLWPN